MNIDKLRKKFPDENSCRQYFEYVIWSNSRFCPHCRCNKSYSLKGDSVRPGTYECARCKGQFTIPTKTPMHSIKLPFWTWLQTIYYIVNSSKVVSSVVNQFVENNAHLMTDQHQAVCNIANNYAGHSSVNHLRNE